MVSICLHVAVLLWWRRWLCLSPQARLSTVLSSIGLGVWAFAFWQSPSLGASATSVACRSSFGSLLSLIFDVVLLCHSALAHDGLVFVAPLCAHVQLGTALGVLRACFDHLMSLLFLAFVYLTLIFLIALGMSLFASPCPSSVDFVFVFLLLLSW